MTDITSTRSSPPGAGDLLHGPSDGGARRDDREHRAACHPPLAGLLAGRAAVDGRRVHPRAGKPAHAGRFHRRPRRAQARVPARLAGVLARFASVRACADAGCADRRPGASGDRRLDAEPGGDVDHPQRVRRSGRAGPRDRRLRGDVRAQHRARACARRHACRRRRLAGRLPRERAGRRAGGPRHPPVRARVACRAAAPGRSRRPAPRDRRPGIAHVRDHRGARPRLGLDRHRGGTRRVGARLRHPHPVRASAARAPPGGALVPQRPVLRRQRDRRLRVRGARGVPVPEHALPAGRARAVSVSRRPVHAADGRDGVRSSHRSPVASSAPAARGRRCSPPASR